MSSPSYALLQYGENALNHRYIDHEGRLAFTIQEAAHNPNPVIRLIREEAWSQQHSTIMGPDNSYFYLGPESTAGYIVYGNNRTHIPMNFFLRPGRNISSRYFRAQSGKDYKWRIGSHRMECLDGHTTLATWEVSPPHEEFYARLILKPNAMPLVTEIVTTLVLNHMAMDLGW